MTYMWVIGPTRKPDPGLSVNGVLAGLVAITASCAFVTPLSAVIIGLVAGVLVCFATFALERLRIDDPVGAAPVHLVNGAWGLLAVGIFASGNPITAGWNGVSTPVTGLLYGGGGQNRGADPGDRCHLRRGRRSQLRVLPRAQRLQAAAFSSGG